MTTQTTIDVALAMMASLESREKEYNIVNKSIKQLQPDFPSCLNVMDFYLWEPMYTLLDQILGDDIASYYFCEARQMDGGGKIVESDGKEWPIRNLDDVKAYVGRNK